MKQNLKFFSSNTAAKSHTRLAAEVVNISGQNASVTAEGSMGKFTSSQLLTTALKHTVLNPRYVTNAISYLSKIAVKIHALRKTQESEGGTTKLLF